MTGEVQTVLVVEDSEDCTATLDIALTPVAGIQLHAVRSAEEALAAMETRSIAALITDIHLPGMDGLELVSRVRSDPRHSRIPILVISGASESDAPERARAAGASAFFTKPFSPVFVRRTLEALIHAD